MDTFHVMDDVQTLERGELRVALRPRVGHEGPVRFIDVQRFFLLTQPSGRDHWRRIVVGRKRMPEAGEREWAYVDRIAHSIERVTSDLEASTYDTKTLGVRHQPGFHTLARGEYAIARHADHVHFLWSLPGLDDDDPVDLRRDLRLTREGSVIAAVFNPQDYGFYEPELMRRFQGVRKKSVKFAPLEPPFLDYVGTELVMVCAANDPMTLRAA